MKIIETTVKAMGEAYGRLFTEIFGHWEEHHIPDIVFLFLIDSEDDIIGFASGFQTKRNEIYLQWGGEREIYRGFKSKKRLRQIRDYLHNKYEYIITTISSENNQMLRLYLSIGYKIYGTKHSTDGITYVELISKKE